MTAYPDFIPVNMITGFLGSGKTTLLQGLLKSPRLANTAVLINEFGEVGLDHLLLERVDQETVVMQSGCICCTIRSDLSEAIRELYGKRERGEVPPFDRLVIETTGLADPAPIVFTLMAEPVIRHHFRLGNIVTTVDAVNGALHLRDNPESVKQVAVADRLVLTKTDIAKEDRAEEIRAELRRLNPSAPIFDAAADGVEPDDLLTNDLYGEDVLRVKGLLNVRDMPAPVVIHGVQHVIHPPVHLDRWPDADHRSRIVFIVRDLEQAVIEASLAAFNRLGEAEGRAA